MQLENISVATRLATEKNSVASPYATRISVATRLVTEKNSIATPHVTEKNLSCNRVRNWKKNQLHLHLQLKKLQLKLTTSRATKQIPTKAVKTSQQHKDNKSSLKNKFYTWVMHKMKRIKYKEKSAKNKLNVWSILVYVCTNTTKNG